MNISVPDTYVKPTVRWDICEEERTVLEATHAIVQVVEPGDQVPEKPDLLNPNVNPDILNAQEGILLVMRIFIRALQVGNTIDDAHLAVIAMLDTGPEDLQSVALEWANPDMSELTGEAITDPAPELSRQVLNTIKRIERVFKKCAATMPSILHWSKMGLHLGLDPELVADAAGSTMDFDYIFGDHDCNCSECVKHREEQGE